MDVVCGTDFSADARRASETAAAIAARTGGKLTLVHGLELPTVGYVSGDAMIFPPTVLDAEKTRKDTSDMLDTEARRISAMTGATVESFLEVGAGDSIVVEAASRVRADLIVVGSHGRRAPIRWILGSTAERLTAISPVPVLVTRGTPVPLVEWAQKTRTIRILLAADFEDSFGPAAAFAMKLVGTGADHEIHVVHACELPIGEMGRYPYAPPLTIRRVDLEANAEAELRRHAASFGLTLRADTMHLVWGRAPGAIATFAKEGRFDLVVAGTHGRRGLDRALLGSVAHGLLRRCAMPVLIVPYPPK